MNAKNTVVSLRNRLSHMQVSVPVGRVLRVQSSLISVGGLSDTINMGDRLLIEKHDGSTVAGEVIQIVEKEVHMLPEGSIEGVGLGLRVSVQALDGLAPDISWLGRVISPDGAPLDGKPLAKGPRVVPLKAEPPLAAKRRALGARLGTGLAVFNTLLPIVTGQRVGLFAGSGVGKSSLLGQLAQSMEADVIVVALIGERGREVRHFVEDVLGPSGLARSVVVAATSDQSPLLRRRCAWSAMAIAEHFRDLGKSVLLLADSVTRFAEAHREIAVTAGEAPVLRGYPPSTAHAIMSLCERAGTGTTGQGDITAVFTVLVAGSDMDEPIADILRGVLDGHVVLDRAIAERGRFPAVDVLRSVSRSLPTAASDAENKSISATRRLLGSYAKNEMMINAGLYVQGSDPTVDQAVNLWPEIDGFLAQKSHKNTKQSFDQLNLILRRGKVAL